MKKVLALLLALMFVFSCTACGGDNDTTESRYLADAVASIYKKVCSEE